jgi:hypothetical protein
MQGAWHSPYMLPTMVHGQTFRNSKIIDVAETDRTFFKE